MGWGFVKRIIFSDEVTFHLSWKVNSHNIRIWGTEKTVAVVVMEHDSPKLNMFYAVSRRRLFGLFLFVEESVTGWQPLLQNGSYHLQIDDTGGPWRPNCWQNAHWTATMLLPLVTSSTHQLRSVGRAAGFSNNNVWFSLKMALVVIRLFQMYDDCVVLDTNFNIMELQ
jgi:hypothetical protein